MILEKINIESGAAYMVDVLAKLQRGQYQIPEFQRDFSWTNKQVIDLVDSILKGYPIGSIILWKPQSATFLTISNLQGGLAEATTEGGYVLDGRQRLTAMLSALYPEGELAQHLYVDLENERQVLWQENPPSEKRLLLKLSDAVDPYTLIDYLTKVKNSKLSEDRKNDLVESAKRVNNILLKYNLGLITVNGGEIDDAVELFSRLNSSNTKMSTDYLIQARCYAKDSEFLFAKAISEIKNDLARYNFDGVKRDFILKCAYNYTNKVPFDAKTTDLMSMEGELPTIMEKTRKDVNNAVRFLYEMCGMVDPKLLPYAFQFILVAGFFKENEYNESDTRLGELRKWFFYTTYTNYFISTSLSQMRLDWEVFSEFAKGIRTTAMEYKDSISFAALGSKTQFSSARACALSLSLILKYKLNTPEATHVEWFDIRPDDGMTPVWNRCLCVNKEMVTVLKSKIANGASWDDSLCGYGFTQDLWELYHGGDESQFRIVRYDYLLQQEKEMAALLMPGIKVI